MIPKCEAEQSDGHPCPHLAKTEADLPWGGKMLLCGVHGSSNRRNGTIQQKMPVDWERRELHRIEDEMRANNGQRPANPRTRALVDYLDQIL